MIIPYSGDTRRREARLFLRTPCGGSRHLRRNHSTQVYRPLGPRFRLLHLTTRLRAWLPSNSSQNSLFCKLLLQQVTAPAFGGRGPLPTSGASRLVSMPSRSRRKVPNHIQASLEEARVRRTGRKAGIVNGRNLERRRCVTGIMRAESDAPTSSQLRRPAARDPGLGINGRGEVSFGCLPALLLRGCSPGYATWWGRGTPR